MPIVAGTRLGRFEVLTPIGAGGMGEVYRARDLDLGRDVALKVLRGEVANDPDRLARFEREARAAASISHPNILQVFEVGRDAQTPFVITELLSGQTLRSYMGGPLELRRALDYVTQIAHGLAAAHDRGIVHRDVKPENVFITTDGHVKLLDFGIATFAAAADVGTVTSLTAPGVIVGSSGYMAPEQVRGEAIDPRADLFALGVVFYEMLAGRRPFLADTGAETMAAILKETPPPISTLHSDLPAGVARIVHRCLEKRRDDRFQAALDVAYALEAVGAPERVAPHQKRWPQRVGVGAAVLLAGLAGAIGGSTSFRAPSVGTGPTLRATIDTRPSPMNSDIFVPFALTPNGEQIAVATPPPGGLLLRARSGFEPVTIPGTSGAFDPFFSPDGQWLGFWAFGEIRKVPLAGGPAVAVCRSLDMLGASWGPDGTIVFAAGLNHGLSAVPAGGGDPVALTTLDAARGEYQHVFPQHVAGGRAIVFTVASRSKDAPFSVEAFDLTTRSRRLLVAGAQHGRYLSSGHLVFVRDGNLYAVRASSETFEPLGQAVVVQKDVHAGAYGEALFAVSAEGTLLFSPSRSEPARDLVFVDRSGVVSDLGLPTRAYAVPRLSSDGATLAVAVRTATTTDIWTGSLRRRSLDRLTFDRRTLFSFNEHAFSTDGTQLSYAEDAPQGSRVVTHHVDGSRPPQEVLTWTMPIAPARWFLNGEALTLNVRGADSGGDVLVWRTGADRRMTPLAHGEGNQFGGFPSKDGRFVAYASDESGRFEIYLAPYPGPGSKRQLTTEGGEEAVWSRDGREVFYRSGDRMMAMAVSTSPAVVVGPPRTLFQGKFVRGAAGLPAYDVAVDGRFLMMRDTAEPLVPELRLVTNWFSDLARLVP